jgi:hypothetical protein
VNNDGIRCNLREEPLTNAILAAVLVEIRNKVLLLALKLHTQGDHHIEPLKTGLKLIENLHLSLTERSPSEILRYQGVRTDEPNLVTKREVCPYATASYAGVAYVTNISDLESLDATTFEVLTYREQIEKCLRGMFMLTVTGVHNGGVRQASCSEVWSSALRVPHDENIGLH